MAKKIAENVEGRYYVDTNCINCSLCPEIAPTLFATNHDEGYEFIKKQPCNEEEFKLLEEAIRICPADAIRDDG